MALEPQEVFDLARTRERIAGIERRLDREDEERRRREDQHRNDEEAWRDELRGRLGRIEEKTERINVIEGDARAREVLCESHAATANAAMARVVALESSIASQLAAINGQLGAISSQATAREAEQRGTLKGASWVMRVLWGILGAGGGAIILRVVEVLHR